MAVENRVKAAAFAYRDKLGFSVIPVRPKDKRPDLVNWEPYIQRHATDEEINEWFRKWPDANIGIVTGRISGVSVIDIDTPEAEEELFRVIPEGIVTPIAVTPRGGKHMFFKYNPAVPSVSSKIIPHVDTKSDGGMVVVSPSERQEGRYSWIEELKPSRVPMAEFPATYIEKLEEARAKAPISKPSGASLPMDGEMFKEGRRDEDLFYVANHLAKSGMPESDIYRIVRGLAQRACDPPFDPAEADIKVESALKRAAQRERNIGAEVRAWAITQLQPFRIESCFTELGLRHPEQIKASRQAMTQLIHQGFVEIAGRGFYRLIDKSLKYIKPKKNDPIDVWLPLGLPGLVKVHPHDVIIVAGSTGAGKTAFSLNVAQRNMARYPVRYIASELTEDDVDYKTDHLPDLKEEIDKDESDPTKRVEMLERMREPWDIISPDAINIIDYLERHDDFFAVSGDILKCFEKLGKGICIICLQKNPGVDHARGGAATTHKCSLAINLEKNVATIAKARWWATPEYNPVGRAIDYTLEHGQIMIASSSWR